MGINNIHIDNVVRVIEDGNINLPLINSWTVPEYHSKALTLNTDDHYMVGYCPRYLCSEVFNLSRQDYKVVELHVERVNLSPTPFQFRLLCSVTAQYSDEFHPFSSPEYQPLMEKAFAY